MSFKPDGLQTLPPLVSIVINNYNYGHFLGEAIDSALCQTYPNTEIIVVDDGSTDNSRDIIAEYAQRLKPVFKHNEGQASAFNTGFSNSLGEIVIFLDADDLLLPKTVENAVPLFDSSNVVKVHWPLMEVDADGKELGSIHRDHLIEGDFREQFIRRGPISLSQSPTSGNAWPRWFLQEVMPLPEHEDKHCADGFLKKLCPIFGVIRRVAEPQGYYRIHSSNYSGNRDEMFKIKGGLQRYPTYCRLLAEHLGSMGITVNTNDWMGPGSEYEWLENYVLGSDDVLALVPESDTLLLIDNERLGDGFLPKRNVFNFGSPENDKSAIEELGRWYDSGVRWVVIGFTAFWLLDDYRDFFANLRKMGDCLYEGERVIVYVLRG
jgi:glycosyltransferase involved in cell wall biosynthesis